MNAPQNVRSLARFVALGLLASVAVAAVAQTEGDRTANSRKPVVGIVNPGPGPVTQPFRVQVRVFSPKLTDETTAQPIGANGVVLNYDGATTGSVTLARMPNYTGSNPESGVWGAVINNLVVGEVYILTASATNGSGTVQSGPIVVTVATKGDGNLLVRDNSDQLCSDCHLHKPHSSEATSPVHYGSWYTGCRTCHQPHSTTNASLVAKVIQPPDVNGALPPKQVVFSNRRGFYATGGASNPAGATYANGDRTGICQVCHTRTQFYRQDGNDYPAPSYTATPSGGHYPTSSGGCMSCHTHVGGMKASCNSCHGASAGRASAISGVTDSLLAAAPPVTPTTAAPIVANGGRHASHTNSDTLRTNALLCSDCHQNFVHADADVDFGWSTLATGSGAKLVTPSPTGTTTTTWVGNPTCTNYCHGASLANGFSGNKVAVKWNTAATLGCTGCHGAPPSTPSHSAGMTQCTPCHEDGYAPTGITTSAAKLLHIDGKVDASGCTGCHGNDAIVAVAGADTAVDAAPPKPYGGNTTDAITVRGVGVHDTHVNSATISTSPIACSECHQIPNAHAATPGSEEAQVVWGTIATGRGTVTPAPWAYPTCSNVYCHNPTPATPGTTPAPAFNARATLGCVGCHDDATSLSSGSHALHVADAPAYKGATFNCLTCHPDVNASNDGITNKAAHVDGYKTVAAGTSWNGTTCASNACHSDGRETPNYVSATWGTGAAGGTCIECHGREAGSIAGAPWYTNVPGNVQTANSHAKHVSAATDCAKCHPTTTQASGALIAGGGDHLNGARNVSAGSGISFSYNEVSETCSNISCHGGKTATWGQTLGCTGCHGDAAKTQNATTVDPLFASAPPVDATGASTGVKVGAHEKHVNSSTYREAAFACTECHTAASLTSHNQTRDAGWGITATNNSAVTPTPLAGTGAYDAWSNPYNCTNYCHGATLTGGTNTSPSWTSTGMTCTSCHGTTGLTSGSHALHLADAPSYKGTTYGCVTCHDTANNTSILIKSQHVDRAVSTAGTTFSGGACASNYCHSDGRETPNYVSATWGTGAAGGTCIECHGREAGSIAGAPWYTNVPGNVQTANSHDKHVAAATDCVKCHATTVTATGAIIAGGGDHLNSARNVSPNAGITFTYDEAAETCSNISCHGGKTATWGQTLGCTGCHGDAAKTKTASTVDPNWQSAPPVDTTGASTGVKVGAHYKHTTSNTYRTAGLQCVDCHTAASLTSHNQSRDAFWSTLATGGGAATPTPAAGTGAYDAWSNPYNCTNYCHGATLAGGTTPSPSWTGTFASVTCTQCHGGPPPVDTGANDHPQNTSCDTCHGIFSNAGYNFAAKTVTGNAGGTHIDGTTQVPNKGCASCHGDVSVTNGTLVGATDYRAAPGANATAIDTHGNTNTQRATAPGVGAHIVHVNAGDMQANACTVCHPTTTDSTHANGTVAMAFAAPANAMSVSPTHSLTAPYNCTNYCHSNAGPIGITGTEPAPTLTTVSWVSTTATTCASCHGDASSGLSARHAKHLASGTYNLDCSVCHATTGTRTTITTPANHVNGTKNNGFGTYNGVNQSSASYTSRTTVPNFTCNTTYCHSNGTTTAPTFGAPTRTLAWSNGTANADCADCHGGNASAGVVLATGSHTAHINSATYTGIFGCVTCHSGTVSADRSISTYAAHINGTKNVSASSWNGTTCASNACHSNGTETPLVAGDYKPVTWGNTLANDCKGCHGTEAGGLLGAPWYANSTGSYKTRNSHPAHVKATDTAVVCNNCHAATVGATGALTVVNHLDLDGVPEISGANIGSYTDATETCNSVSCHGGNSPQWGATLDCSACHMGATGATDADVDDYTYGNGTAAKIDPEDWINYGHGKASGTYDSGNNAAAFDTAIAVSADDGCKFCHDSSVAHGLATNPFRLANVGAGTTDAQKVGVCTVCHGGAGYLGKTSSKAIDATHYGTKHATNGKGGELCWDCHDPHGDYKYSATAGILAYMIDETPSRTHAVAEGSATEWGKSAVSAAATPEFRKALGTSATAWDWGDYARSTRTGVCQVCHTATLHFTNTTWVTTAGGDSTHNNTAGRCTSCHGHDQAPTSAFKESGCNGCHGTQTPRTPVNANTDPMLDFAPPKGAPPENSLATTDNEVGAHFSHVNQVTLRANPLLCSDCHGTGLPKHAGGAWATISWGSLATTGSVTPDYTQGTGCSLTYCHGNFKNGNDQITWAAPSTPTDPTFSAIGTTSLTVEWTGSGAQYYVLERGTSSTGPWVQIALPAGPSFVDDGLFPGVTYWYRVRGSNPSGDSSYSGPTSQATTSAGMVPTQFDMVGSATTSIDGGNTNVSTTTTSLTATTGTTFTNRDLATTNYVYSSTTQRRVRPSASMTNGTTYNFVDIYSDQLTAGNNTVGAGVDVSIDNYMSSTGSASSAIWTATLYENNGTTNTSKGTCDASYVPNAGTTTHQTSTCTISNAQWTAAVGSRLKLRLQIVALANWGRPALLWGSNQVTSGTLAGQTFFVAGLGQPYTPPSAPTSAPTGLNFPAASATSLTLAWGSVSGASVYEIDRGASSTGPWTQVGQSSTTSFIDRGLTESTTYWYRVRASNAGGDGPNSGSSSRQTPAAAGNAVSWTGTFVPGSSTLTCSSCHGNPPGGTHPSLSNCDLCHIGYTSSSVDKTKHMNQTVDVVDDCTVCHAYSMGSRREVVSEFSLAWSHKKSAASQAVVAADCIVCHMEGDAATGKPSATYHMNGKLNFRDPDTGTNIMAATGFSQTVYNDSTNGGAYTFSTTAIAEPTGFSRNLGVALEDDPNFLNIAAIQIKLCLGCHDSNGATSTAAQVPGGSAGKPFGTAITGAGYAGASGLTACSAENGCVTDINASFATSNASYHPIRGRQNNSYVSALRMQPPWNVKTKTMGTINTAGSWGYLISCWDCHAPLGTSRTEVLTSTVTAHGGATQLRQANWVVNATNLCNECHLVVPVVGASTSNHGTGSAFSGGGNSTPGGIARTSCFRCHGSTDSATSVDLIRPIRGQDAHGFDTFTYIQQATTNPPDTNWPVGTSNTLRPYAFMRNAGPQGMWKTTGWTMGNCNTTAGSGCSRSSQTYTPGGTF